MPKNKKLVDDIGFWSEVKHDVLYRYIERYSQILSKQPMLTHAYIEGFAFSGVNWSREKDHYVMGSPLIALALKPPFTEYHFVELDEEKAALLRRAALSANNPDVHFYVGDCNKVLPMEVFPRFQRRFRKRAFCLLDPYGLGQLDWRVVCAAGVLGTMEVMINFPVMDLNMNVFWRNPDAVSADQAQRLTRFWGDDTWREVAWSTQDSLFDDPLKTDVHSIIEAYGNRLKEVAGFRFVATSKRFANRAGSTLYYLFFATQNETGYKIGRYVLSKFT